MFNREYDQRAVYEGRFHAVKRPSKAEGVGRALQIAFRDGDLPAELRECLERIDCVAAC